MNPEEIGVSGPVPKNNFQRMLGLEDIGEILIKRGKKIRISDCNFEAMFSYNLTVIIFSNRFK